jgi:hypothetical protein
MLWLPCLPNADDQANDTVQQLPDATYQSLRQRRRAAHSGNGAGNRQHSRRTLLLQGQLRQ